MTFWTSRYVTPKTKSKFIVKIDEFTLKNVKAVTKPAVEVNTKEFKLINHYFNYPGITKWQPITITFVDMKGDYSNGQSFGSFSNGMAGNQLPDTAAMLYDILRGGGYSTPKSGRGAAMSKEGFAEGLKNIKIQQISPGRTDPWMDGRPTDEGRDYTYPNKPHTVEQWTLVNPIVKSIKWGDLNYGSDDLVEYTLDIVYDYAIFDAGSPESFESADFADSEKAKEDRMSEYAGAFGNIAPPTKE